MRRVLLVSVFVCSAVLFYSEATKAATTLPVGSIVASILSPSDFAKQMPKGEVWQLADGTPVPQGPLQALIRNSAEYRALNPSNVAHKPDLRGVFLRGKNAKRNDNMGNPGNVELDVGSYQSDDVGPHTHGQRVGYPDAGGADSGDRWHGEAGTQTGNPTTATGYDRLETRPRNVTVYYYIRVK
jgi:hypothetical protein